MRTFVTGAAGFIGSTLVDRLLADGHHVVGIDDLVSGRIANLDHARRSDGFTFIEDSVTSSALADLVATAAPEAIFHLAAQVDVRKSVDDPFHDARTNVLGTINILEASRRAGVQRIVFAASGGSRYGEPTDLPVGEDVPPNPLSPYAAAKVAGELYLGAYAGMYGLAPICLALANVYGPRQDPHGEAGVVAIFGSAMLTGDQPPSSATAPPPATTSTSVTSSTRSSAPASPRRRSAARSTSAPGCRRPPRSCIN